MFVTQPGLHRSIWAIAVPAFAALISEPLMIAADTAIVGQLGREELAALGASSTVLSSVVGLCIFLAYGSTAAVARQQGAGNRTEAMSSAMGAVWLAGGLGFGLAALIGLSTRQTAHFFSSSAAVQELTQNYLQIAAWSVPAALLVMATTGALRGVLDLRTPLIVMIAANVINVVATLILVFGFNFGLKGAAAGLVFAQWCAAAWLLLSLRIRVREAGGHTHPRVATIIASARDGVALLIRTASLRTVLLLATWLASNLGDVALAAHQVVMTIVLLSSFALDAIAIAGQTLTGHALGASKLAEAREITRTLINLGWISGITMGLAIGLGSGIIPMAFSADSSVRNTAAQALVVVAIAMPISGAVYVLDGILIGAGDGRYLAWAGVFTMVMYLPLAAFVHFTQANFTMLWLAYGLFMLARFVTLWLRQRSDAWLVLGARLR